MAARSAGPPGAAESASGSTYRISEERGARQAVICGPEQPDLTSRRRMRDTPPPVDDRLAAVDHAGMDAEDRMRWAETLAIERLHGPDGPRWIAERISALAADGDMAGVGRLREIAWRYERLIAVPPDGVTIRS